MIDVVYYETDVAEHPRTSLLRERFPRADWIECSRYGEVFNRRGQSFRLQKKRPSLILARKHGNFVLETPKGYGIGDPRNYYFSHMLNCVYDCRYCFLQGMYQSAHYVLFVNFEDFEAAIDERIAEAESPACFFSGYDCDSLAMESTTGFVNHILPWFEARPSARMELRTKSLQADRLLKRAPLANVVVAFSLTPEAVSAAHEHKVPPLERRLRLLGQLARHGWPIGLRFDPLIYQDGYRGAYRELFRQVRDQVDGASLHSASLGVLRFPRSMFDSIVRQYPEEPLLAVPEKNPQGMVSYPVEVEADMLKFCQDELASWVPSAKLFSATTEMA